jgi:dihydrofolate reductase
MNRAQGSHSTKAAPRSAARDGAPVYLVAAVAENGVIGANGKLPWHLPEDLQHFKQLTLGHPVIMGRKTWESIGRPLPNRNNIVVSRRAGFHAAGASVALSLEDALALCAGPDPVFIIGGNELYRAALPYAAGLVLTRIHRSYEGDAHFPEIHPGDWKETRREERVAANGIAFDIVWYERAA